MNQNDAEFYSPSLISSIANNSTVTQEFQGLDAGLLAFNKLNIGCDDPTKLNQIKVRATLDEGRRIILDNVQLEALKRLFQLRSLHGGFVIDESRKLKLEVTNSSGATRVVSIDLNGYDQPAYEELVSKYEARGSEIPKPEFLYATATIAAGATKQKVSINIPRYSTNIHRIAISSTSDDNLQTSFKVQNTEYFPNRFISAYNDQFKNMGIIEPIRIDRRIPFVAEVTNIDQANPYEISIVCEAYRID
jgi:hypothetical protein